MIDQSDIESEECRLARESFLDSLDESIDRESEGSPERSDHEHVGEEFIRAKFLWSRVFRYEDS